MRALPDGLDEHALINSLAECWSLEVRGVEYLPVGRGSYHWRVIGAQGERHFVTVDDLDEKGWLGDRRETVFEGLRRAFDTAAALRAQGGLDFVVAPVPTVDGNTVARLGSRYTVAVFPFLDARPHPFGQQRSPEERTEVLRLLVELHQATPIIRATASHHRVELAHRRDLDTALHDLAMPWDGGRYSEPARGLLDAHAERVTGLLDAFDRLRDEVTAGGCVPVITHGEPHTGNLMRVSGDLVFFDWDTVGLAPPERDLWMVAPDSGDDLAAYAAATGHEVDPAAMTLYGLRWELDDIAIFVRRLRSAHEATDDSELDWLGLNRYLDDVDRRAGGR